jgi:hypothetical protein
MRRFVEPLLYVLVAVLASAPAWIVAHPPLQDLPYHLATTRVIHSIGDPAYGLDSFVLTLGNTQYLGYYLLADALSYVAGVKGANTILVAAYLGGTVLALRSLLLAVGKDPRLSLLCLPLLVNRLFMLGLLPFLLGVPVLFYALAAGVRFVQDTSFRRGVLVATLALALFFLHVVPFGLFVIGFGAMVALRPWRTWRELLLPLGPSAIATLWWLRMTKAGKRMLEGGGEVLPFKIRVERLPDWLARCFVDGFEGWLLIALVALVIAAAAVALLSRNREVRGDGGFRHGLAVIPLACAVLYFVTPESREIIWPIAGRFPTLCCLSLVPLLVMPKGRGGMVVAAGALVLGALSIGQACRRFVAFERTEMGDIEGAVASIPPGMHVAAVIGPSHSNIVNVAPLVHAVSYYQLEKGGVVAFTFTGYPHWPIAFKTSAEPPTGPYLPVGWEWQPHTSHELSKYYDYVLTRGSRWNGPEYALHFADPSGWRVWRRLPPGEVKAAGEHAENERPRGAGALGD